MRTIYRFHFERLRRGWTQTQLGEKARIRQSDVSALERGRLNPTEDELLRLANALSVWPPSVLMKPTAFTEADAEAYHAEPREVRREPATR